MPTHVFHPLRNPPTWRDRVLVHPWETVVALIAIAFGVATALSGILDTYRPSVSLAQLPAWTVILVSVFLILGGILCLLGLNWSGDEVSHGWALERLGWVLAAGGFIAYAIPVGFAYPGSTYAWGVPILLAGGCALRAKSIRAIEKSVRQEIAELKGDQ